MANFIWQDWPGLNLARGKVRGASVIHKFGATPQISTSTTATIWDITDTVYPWSAFNTPGVINVDCDSASDIGHTVTITGLDANFNVVTEVINIAVQNNNTGTQVFSRVYRAFFDGTATNVGNVNIQLGTTTVARIQAGKAQTLMAVYTIPAGYKGYLLKGDSTVKAGSDMTLGMYVRYGGVGAFRIGHQAEVSPNGYQYDFPIPMELPEKSDIDIRAYANTNNVRATAVFDIVLIKDSEFAQWSNGY
jgi:hypothetical protein